MKLSVSAEITVDMEEKETVEEARERLARILHDCGIDMEITEVWIKE